MVSKVPTCQEYKTVCLLEEHLMIYSYSVLISRPSQSMDLEKWHFLLQPGIYAPTPYVFQKGGNIHC